MNIGRGTPAFSAVIKSLAKIGVRPADPVSPRWAKYIQIHGVLDSLGTVWNVRRNHQDLSCANRNLAVREDKLQRTLNDIGDLLILMAVQRNGGAGAKHQTSQHALLAVDKLSLNPRIQVLDGRLCQANVLDLR